MIDAKKPLFLRKQSSSDSHGNNLYEKIIQSPKKELANLIK